MLHEHSSLNSLSSTIGCPATISDFKGDLDELLLPHPHKVIFMNITIRS